VNDAVVDDVLPIGTTTLILDGDQLTLGWVELVAVEVTGWLNGAEPLVDSAIFLNFGAAKAPTMARMTNARAMTAANVRFDNDFTEDIASIQSDRMEIS